MIITILKKTFKNLNYFILRKVFKLVIDYKKLKIRFKNVISKIFDFIFKNKSFFLIDISKNILVYFKFYLSEKY